MGAEMSMLLLNSPKWGISSLNFSYFLKDNFLTEKKLRQAKIEGEGKCLCHDPSALSVSKT